jgi:8-oxo-dGTP diphosphatase
MSEQEEQGPIVSVVGLVTNGDYVLLIKHKQRKKWEMPGGKMKRGETLYAALRREVLEEAGVDIDTLSASINRPVIEQDATCTWLALICWVSAETTSPLVLPTPHAANDATDARWFHLLDIPWDEASPIMSKTVLTTWARGRR